MKRKRYESSNGTYLRRAKNRKAFQGVIESYLLITSNSVVKVMDTSDISGGTPNPATPSTIDFLCDVDNVVKKVFENTEERLKFYRVINGTDSFNEKDYFKYEQAIGKLFIARQLWPVKKYFTVQRKRYEKS